MTMSFAHAFISFTKSAVMYLGTLKLKLVGSAEYISLSHIVDGLKSPVNNHIFFYEINICLSHEHDCTCISESVLTINIVISQLAIMNCN